jgi:hypothetical protein
MKKQLNERELEELLATTREVERKLQADCERVKQLYLDCERKIQENRTERSA